MLLDISRKRRERLSAAWAVRDADSGVSAIGTLMRRGDRRFSALRGPGEKRLPFGERHLLCRLLPHGGHLQKIVIADVKGLLVLFPDAVIDFLTIHADIFRHFKAELDLAALYLEDADSNVVANVDAFACTSAQY